MSANLPFKPRTKALGSQPTQAHRPPVAAGAKAIGGNLPLWRPLQASAQMLHAVRSGRSLTAALETLDGAVRPAAQALSFQTLRWLGRAQALRQLLARRAPPPAADALLCTALALLWQAQPAAHEAHYDDHTLVDQTVEAARRQPATQAQAAFINACLRRFLRERVALVAATDSQPQAQWNHPDWWIAQVQRDQPGHWLAILNASQNPAPMTLRVNTQQTTVAAYLEALRAAGADGVATGESGIVLDRPRPVSALPGFAQGWVSVQDGAAQLAAPLLLRGLDLTRPLRILDACAAPGGKTAHLLELCPSAELTALDVDPTRCQRVGENLARLQLRAQVQAADAAQPSAWWDGTPFDAILLDAPCTASGIVRRHPDVRWLRRASDIAQLAALQARLLQALWPLVAPGGSLLYCTCSVFAAEGRDQIETFLAHHSEAHLSPSPGHLMPQSAAKGAGLPDNAPSDHDGFFYAHLHKRMV